MSALDAILSQPKVTHDLIQGSPEWDAFRIEHDGASEAAAMLGVSKKVTRTELLQVKHTGLAREFSDFVQKRVLDKGHEVEALARPIIEAEIGEDFYPTTFSRGRLSASCDGITLGDELVLEHKLWNEELAASVRAGIVPEEYMPQCQQILLVTEAGAVKFVVSDGTPEKMVSVLVEPDRAWWERIAAGWEQFHVDLTTYTPPQRTQPIVAEPVQALPAVTVQVSGSITVIENFKVFETAMRDFLEHRLIREPKSDQDFADLEVQIKAMKGAEAALEAAEGQMLAQIQSVDQAKKNKDMLHKLVRDNRLMAEKLFASEKERRKAEILASGIGALREHVAKLNERIGKAYMPAVPADFAGAIKGRSSMAKMEDAIGSELARAKIEANRIADGIQINLNWLREHAKDYASLFPDTGAIVLKAHDDLVALASNRINAHKAAEAKKEEETRERIRAEEAARLQREQDARDQEAARQTAKAATPVPTAAPAAIAAPALSTKPAAANSPSVVPITRGKPTLRLGQINERIAPLKVDAAGLEALGFKPAGREGASVLFHEADFGAMVDSMVASLRTAQQRQPVAA